MSKKTGKIMNIGTGKIVTPHSSELSQVRSTTRSVKKKDGKIYAIVYDVWISGTKLGMDKKLCITSIEIKESVEGSDSATIQISDPEFLYIEDNIFIEENSIRIKMGWDSSTYRAEFNGYISAIDINFDSDGIPKLTVTCMDNTHKMNRKKKSKTFKNCTSADVVKTIVKGYGFSCKVDSSYKFKKQETITQSNQTDIDFITKLAGDEVHPFTARLVGNTFYYVKMGKLEDPKITLTYRKYPHDIISFSPKINKESKQTEVSGASMNTSNKKISSAKGTSNNKTGNIKKDDSKTKSSEKNYTYNPNSKKWSSNS